MNHSKLELDKEIKILGKRLDVLWDKSTEMGKVISEIELKTLNIKVNFILENLNSSILEKTG